jgi:hypothetical protein
VSPPITDEPPLDYFDTSPPVPFIPIPSTPPHHRQVPWIHQQTLRRINNWKTLLNYFGFYLTAYWEEGLTEAQTKLTLIELLFTTLDSEYLRRPHQYYSYLFARISEIINNTVHNYYTDPEARDLFNRYEPYYWENTT